MRYKPKRSPQLLRGTAFITLAASLVSAFVGCNRPNERMSQPVPREVQPFVIRLQSQDNLREFAERKRDIHPDGGGLLFVADGWDLAGLPKEAPRPEAMLEKAFTDLAPAGLLFLPRDKRTPTGEELPEKYITIRGQVYLDRVVYSRGRGVNLRGLIGVEDDEKFIEPSLDFDVESELSTLRVSLWGTDPTGLVMGEKAELQVDLAKDITSERYALLFYGSGAGGYQKVTAADGLGSAIQTVMSHALLVYLGRKIGVDYWRCGLGDSVDPLVLDTLRQYPEPYKVQMAGRLLFLMGYLQEGTPFAEFDKGQVKFAAEFQRALEKFCIERGLAAPPPRLNDDVLFELMAARRTQVRKSEPAGQRAVLDLRSVPEERQHVVATLWTCPGVQSVQSIANLPGIYHFVARGAPATCTDHLRRNLSNAVVQSISPTGEPFVTVHPLGPTATPESRTVVAGAQPIGRVVPEEQQRRTGPHPDEDVTLRPVVMPADCVDFGFELAQSQQAQLRNGIRVELKSSRRGDSVTMTIDDEAVTLRSGVGIRLKGRSSQEQVVLTPVAIGSMTSTFRVHISST